MANPAPTINQINAFNATQGTTIDFNIIGGTELVRSNRIYIYDLSDNSLICTHLYVSTESIHELPPNTDGSIVYESGKSSADFVNGAQYYAQIQTFTDIGGTEGGSGLSVAKMFWCLVDPTLTITTIPSTISTTSYNVSATYNANTSVVSNIIQQYQFSLYSATGSLLQSSGVVVGSGTQQGTSTIYDISYNFTGLSVGSSYYVAVDVTTTQGMSITTQSNTFTVSIDTPTLGEATVVNNACDGYISVTSNLSSEYGGSGSGEIVSFETDSENVFTKLQVNLDPIQDLHGYDAPWVGGAGVNLFPNIGTNTINGVTYTTNSKGEVVLSGTCSGSINTPVVKATLPAGTYHLNDFAVGTFPNNLSARTQAFDANGTNIVRGNSDSADGWSATATISQPTEFSFRLRFENGHNYNGCVLKPMLTASTYTGSFQPYSNICPISGHDEVDVVHTGKNLFDESVLLQASGWTVTNGVYSGYNSNLYNKYYPKSNMIPLNCKENTSYTWSIKYRNATSGGATYFVVFYSDGTGESINRDSQTEVQLTLTSNPNKTLVGVGFSYASPSVIYIREIQIEEGTTATAYEPYTAEEIHQDIEATYTPTVQENEPYQFKRTGDVGGDRESIELVGGSVAWNQLIQSMTSDYWRFYHANGSFSNGVCSFTATQSDWNLALKNTSYPALYANHKYLFSFAIKAESNTTNVMARFSDGVWDKTVNPTTGWVEYSTIKNKSSNTAASVFYVMDKKESDYVRIDVKNFITIDLTQLFGSTIADYIYSLEQANAGAGVAFFRKYFSNMDAEYTYLDTDGETEITKKLRDYQQGVILSVEGVSAHVTTGFNQFDENNLTVGYRLGTSDGSPTVDANSICSADFIPCLSNTIYHLHCGDTSKSQYVYIFLYDAEHNFVDYWSFTNTGERNITTQSNVAYFKVSMYAYGTTYNNDICINLSWDGERNGEYEPYVEHSYPLDDSLTLRGIPKIANGKLYYDGDTYESDGTVTRKYGIVDLGSLTWELHATNRFYAILSETAKPTGSYDTKANLLCDKYDNITQNQLFAGTKGIATQSLQGTTVYVYDSAYSDENAFKTAMNGVYLVYELATPTTETAEPFESIQKVTPNYGTEEFVTTTNVPVGNNTQYLTRDIYGGYIDLISGTLVVTHKITTISSFDGTFGVAPHGYSVYKSLSDRTKSRDTISNMFISSTFGYDNMPLGSYQGNSGAVTTWTFILPSTITSLAEANTWLSNLSEPLVVTETLATPLTYQLTPQQIQTLVGQNNVWSEQGDVELSYHIPITNLLVKRQDVDDVSGSWLTLYSQPITQASDMDFTFIDFTNQYGKTYKYALVPLLTQTQSGVEVEVEGGYTVSDEVQSVFDGVFIVDSTGSQKCKANVGYGNVDMNQTVGAITPIGAKYPVVITNSKNQYHNGSISGTIVPDDYYFNGNLSRIDMVNKRSELEQFLTNKRAKIIKDWNGNIWLVMIMDNVSCTFNNNYGMGIVNFNTNWVEVGDPTNQQDLQATGLINVGGV